MFGQSGSRHDASGVSARHRALVPPGRNRSETPAAGPFRSQSEMRGGNASAAHLVADTPSSPDVTWTCDRAHGPLTRGRAEPTERLGRGDGSRLEAARNRCSAGTTCVVKRLGSRPDTGISFRPDGIAPRPRPQVRIGGRLTCRGGTLGIHVRPERHASRPVWGLGQTQGSRSARTESLRDPGRRSVSQPE